MILNIILVFYKIVKFLTIAYLTTVECNKNAPLAFLYEDGIKKINWAKNNVKRKVILIRLQYEHIFILSFFLLRHHLNICVNLVLISRYDLGLEL